MELSEAEIQVLASLEKAETEGLPADRSSLEDDAERFWIFREDWSDAYGSLAAKGLLEGNDDGYRLTAAGRPLARRYHRQRPDMYWYYYQTFYQAAWASEAHSELCRRVFGEDLCQEGQTDMASLNDLLDLLDLEPGEEVLDLGCGAGAIAEYISDRTGARITGLDYAESAIDEAERRTVEKRSHLRFVQGDMNLLDLSKASLDAAISLDTLYWAADLEKTLSDVVAALRPGGRMGIFFNHHIEEGEDTSKLAPEFGELSEALSKLGLAFETRDYTTQIADFWRRNWRAATDLRDAFEAEGNGFIAASLIRESEEEYLPDIEAGRMARYLYHVRI